jgi:hypothetical protein
MQVEKQLRDRKLPSVHLAPSPVRRLRLFPEHNCHFYLFPKRQVGWRRWDCFVCLVIISLASRHEAPRVGFAQRVL